MTAKTLRNEVRRVIVLYDHLQRDGQVQSVLVIKRTSMKKDQAGNIQITWYPVKYVVIGVHRVIPGRDGLTRNI